MLPFFRKNIKFIIWIIVLSFVIWGAGSFVASRSSSSSYAGSAFGKNISITEFQSMLRFYDIMTRSGIIALQRKTEEKKPETQSTPTPPSAETKEIAENAKRYKEPEPLTEDPKSSEKPEPPTYEEVRSLAWQSIIFSEEAKRMKMEVSNDEVSREILKLFSSESGGFSPAFYQMWVKNQYRGRPREFEEAIRKYICARKIRETILKDVPAEEVEKRWMEWMMKTMGDAHFKDYTLQPSAE